MPFAVIVACESVKIDVGVQPNSMNGKFRRDNSRNCDFWLNDMTDRYTSPVNTVTSVTSPSLPRKVGQMLSRVGLMVLHIERLPRFLGHHHLLLLTGGNKI